MDLPKSLRSKEIFCSYKETTVERFINSSVRRASLPRTPSKSMVTELNTPH
jgi:hypothetical protein